MQAAQQTPAAQPTARRNGARINRATIYSQGENYLSYSDTDSQTDYFHGLSAGQRLTAELLKTDGADEITLHGNGCGLDADYERRAHQVAKWAGYTLTEVRGKTLSGQEWRRFTATRVQA